MRRTVGTQGTERREVTLAQELRRLRAQRLVGHPPTLSPKWPRTRCGETPGALVASPKIKWEPGACQETIK
ncbi:hypothetical protein GCM10023191_034040 [Actinoallomurus oryzae]|uniref:Transposase n=1 Tax=Actinoallomurus oryzae TaxID=502180 RepID=A0ABP8PXZ9_9ACTN